MIYFIEKYQFLRISLYLMFSLPLLSYCKAKQKMHFKCTLLPSAMYRIKHFSLFRRNIRKMNKIYSFENKLYIIYA